MTAIIVIAHAAVQAAIVGLAPRDPLSPVALLLAAVSGVAVILALWLIPRFVGRATTSFLWSAAAGIAIGGSSVVLAPLVPLAVVGAAVVLTAGSPVAAARVVREHPVRSVLLALLTIALVVIGWAAALLCGLLLGGVVGSAATWLVAGVLAALVVLAWSRLALRSSRAEP